MFSLNTILTAVPWVLAVALFGYLQFETNRLDRIIEARDAEIVLLKRDLANADETIEEFKEAAEIAEANLRDAREEAQKQNKQYRRSLDAANKRAATYQQQANQILADQRRPNEDACAAADRILTEALR